jgi:hypothetical protein
MAYAMDHLVYIGIGQPFLNQYKLNMRKSMQNRFLPFDFGVSKT